VNGNAPWAITEVNDHTLQFTLKPGDLWPDNASSRSEIAGGTLYAANSVVNVSYQVTVQPGLADPGLDWEILGQLHADDNSPITASLQADYPEFAFHLTGACRFPLRTDPGFPLRTDPGE
jgi:large repetitive protein